MTAAPALDTERLEAGYFALFPPLMRAAQRACLEYARLTRDGGWPSVRECLDFAALYNVLGAELAAFFGYLSYRESGKTVWVDTFAGDVPPWTAQQRATREQALAFGFQCAFRESVCREAVN